MQDLTQSETSVGPRQPPSARRSALFVFLATTALAVFFAAQNYFAAATMRRAVSWQQAAYWSFTDWYEWALVAPIIFWLCRRFTFERRSWPKSLAIYLFAGILLAGVHGVLCAASDVLQGWVTGQTFVFTKSLRGILANRTHYNLAVFAVIVCAWHAWDYYRKLRERETQAAELAARLAQAQLQTLRMQLNPHFLFNTLNAVSSLMLKDVAAANRMISRLGDLLRLTLEKSDQQEVPLQQEIDFLRRYLDIEQIRFGDRLQLKMEVEPSTLGAAVPHLILQPLVENALHHAIEAREASGQLELRSLRDQGRLVLQVSDNGPGPAPGVAAAPDTHGATRERVGLNNTRERLRKLYGDNQQFDLIKNTMGGVTARLSIPFRLVPTAAGG
ncbi:MAG TPA: histidine kinase [Candidatus Saccharimonadales bacterium]|nr:histidine kinase [Candidatus Saccharimonadales bacterium]